MLRKLILVCAFLCSVPLLCESADSTKYRVATIVAVNLHSSDADSDSRTPSYDVSVQIGNTFYVVLYAPRLALQTAKYAAGRQVLVLVGEDSLTYNDICGNAIEVPILTRKVVAAAGSR